MNKLAQVFAREPELILACLESAGADSEHTPDLPMVLAAVQRAIAEHPDYADLHYFAAQAATRGGRYDEARCLLGHALNLNPDYNDALILAARVAMAQGQQDDALTFLRQALVQGADYADVHVMLGDLWRQRDEVLLARRAYERALEVNTGLGTAHLGLAALGPEQRSGGGA